MAATKNELRLIDQYVGARVKMRRKMMRLSQEKLGIALGVTFQQVQKYEKGMNRIGSSRLQEIAKILQVPVTFFFEGSPQPTEQDTGFNEAPSPTYIAEFISSTDGIHLIEAFIRISDAKLRRIIVELAQRLADNETDEA